MVKRTSVMLAHSLTVEQLKSNFHLYKGWLVSEKYDGMRAWFDGGISRGLRCLDVPYANIEKHDRYVNTVFATGLWTRLYQPIIAPEWFLNTLEQHFPYPLDGELCCMKNETKEPCGTSKQICDFQATMSLCKRQYLDFNDIYQWQNVQYKIFDIPILGKMFPLTLQDNPLGYGPNDHLLEFRVGNNVIKKDLRGCFEWIVQRIQSTGRYRPHVFSYKDVYDYLYKQINHIHLNDNVTLIQQDAITNYTQVKDKLEEVIGCGGEGIMLRNPNSTYECIRSHNLLKIKPYMEGEGTVIGYTMGTGKYEGMLGALIVRGKGGSGKDVTFELSGMTDMERRLEKQYNYQYTTLQYNTSQCNNITSPSFPKGCIVNYKYRGFTDAGIPKNATYFRKVD